MSLAVMSNKPRASSEFPVQQQAAVGTDRRALERELDRDVELQTQRAGFRFTRHVPGQILAPSSLTHCHGKDIMHLDRSEAASIGECGLIFSAGAESTSSRFFGVTGWDVPLCSLGFR